MVWAIVLSVSEAMRRPDFRVRQYVPAPYFFIVKAERGDREAKGDFINENF